MLNGYIADARHPEEASYKESIIRMVGSIEDLEVLIKLHSFTSAYYEHQNETGGYIE